LEDKEGVIHRLEKCGEVETRLLVMRPFRVTVLADRIIRMTVNPLLQEISTEEIPSKKMGFEDSTAYHIAHEMKHLEKKEITGKPLWELRFL
jgi:predicted metalloprotease